MLKSILTNLFLIFSITAVALAQPVKEWSVNAGMEGGFLTSPLLLDLYGPPQYPGSAYYGQEVFVSYAASSSSVLFQLKSNGTPINNIQFDSVIRSSPTGDYFANTGTAQILFGDSNGLCIVSSGLPQTVPCQAGIDAAPVLADLDTDDWQEIVAIDRMGNLYAWNLDDFSPTLVNGFPISLNSSVTLLNLAVGNIDPNSFPEIVAATDDSSLHVLNRFGEYLTGWPHSFGSAIVGSPVIGKIDNFSDGTRNIVVATADARIHVLRLSGGNIMGWPRQLSSSVDTSPILADIDLDNRLEIIVITSDAKVHALEQDGNPVQGWPVDLSAYIGGERANSLFMDPLVVDINGDYMVEVLAPISRNGVIVPIRADGDILEEWIISAGIDTFDTNIYHSHLQASPTISDIDYDGQLELVAATFAQIGGPGGINSPARVKCYELGPDPIGQPYLKPWPIYRQNVYRTGVQSGSGGGQGMAPNCGLFPERLSFLPNDEMVIDFALYANDLDSPSSSWTCSLNGATHLEIVQENNRTFRVINPDGWIGVEGVVGTVIDPDGLSCSSGFEIISGQKGDINGDQQQNLQDITIFGDLVLELIDNPTSYQIWSADINDDDLVTVQDLILLIDMLR
ncbi:MAG: hypothetical protein B6244_09970 [Candidatus Cloacimonetes bacterium 4572_55]|nr:MAG: hypothetical protein B6244_09970 [Candidatus Cloacimonetes bacterium 4572_55]